ncbi:hypothetical protein BD410DRAFT_695500, partial [Rickenella mellea]
MEEQHDQQPLLRAEEIDAMPVYKVIHMIRVVHTPLSYEAMVAPDLTYTLIRPLEEKYIHMIHMGNLAVVFCLLLNRAHFLHDQNMVSSPLSTSRAALCEILAIRALRAHGENMLDLVLATTTSWSVYSGVDEEALKQSMDDLDIESIEDRVGNAIEMAIIGRAKQFIKSSACQKVIEGIWRLLRGAYFRNSGKCVYQADNSHSILSDTYKRTPIHFYDPHKAPLLDHYRLKVPAVRSVLEYSNFLVLFLLFILTLEYSELDRFNWIELSFIIYALGFSLEKVAAMQEHGIRVYFTGTWVCLLSVLSPLQLITIYCTYASLRLYGIRYDVLWAKSSGIDCLALAACMIFPRLAFVTFKDTVMVLALRAMLLQFAFLMVIAAFCFAGFLYALWTYSPALIFWWMADLWFGLDASGFNYATTFHPYFGPILMVAYACLSNTLLLTVLVSILSHTFSSISEDADAEAMFRRAVLTIEGVKADYLFSYQPPINLFALCIMLPASYILSPRWFHKVNVFMIRLTSFPILLGIAWYERQAKLSGSTTFYETLTSALERLIETLPRPLKRLSLFDNLFAGTGSDIDTIFEIEAEMVLNNASALDMRDMDATSSKGGVEASRSRRSSLQTHYNSQHTPDHRIHIPKVSTPPLSPPKDIPKGAASSGHQGTRQRLASILTRPADVLQSFTSPLAQVYQPLIVDDDTVEQNLAGTQLPNQPSGIRRRLSSMVRFPT